MDFDLYHESYYPLEYLFRPQTFVGTHLTSKGFFRNAINAGKMSHEKAEELHSAVLNWISHFSENRPDLMKIINSEIAARGYKIL